MSALHEPAEEPAVEVPGAEPAGDLVRAFELLRRSDRDGSPVPPDDREDTRWGSGVEPPSELPPGIGPRTVVRTFAFVDLCGSTAHLDEHGPLETVRAVTAVRTQIRAITARRGVRVARWLGDGAMIVGVQSGPVVATAVELCARSQTGPLALRAGLAVSSALLFDGDDYLGRGVNFAARLCDAADPGEILCDVDCLPSRPEWVSVCGSRTVEIRGMGEFVVACLALSPGVTIPA